MTTTTTEAVASNLAGQAVRLFLAASDAKGPKAKAVADARLDGLCIAAAIALSQLGVLSGSTETAVKLDLLDVVRPLGDPPGPDSAFGRADWARTAHTNLLAVWS